MGLNVYDYSVPVESAYRSSCLVCLRDSYFSGDWLTTFSCYHAQFVYLLESVNLHHCRVAVNYMYL